MLKQYEILTQLYEGAQLTDHEFEVKVMGTGVTITISEFIISIPYKNHLIQLENEYGRSNSATLSMKIEKGSVSDFKITSRSHLSNLFALKKRLFVVNSNNTQIKSQLEKALVASGMEGIAKENLFEPTIKAERINGVQFIKTDYHLQLKDKIGAAKALIDFYKNIVDLL